MAMVSSASTSDSSVHLATTMVMDRRRYGYALFEALIAVALMVILGMAVAPPLLEDLREGKVARARAETEVIAQAILDFHRDIGHWPEVSRELDLDGKAGRDGSRHPLVGNARVGGGSAAVPDGIEIATAGLATAGVSAGIARAATSPAELATGTMTAHLIRNRTASGEPLYKVSRHPYLEPGWNGPYLDEVPLDPWGRSYLVSTVPIERDGAQEKAVLVLSAGPDGELQTDLTRAPAEGRCAGDDIGLVITRPERPVF
jgi:type II secretory pathway pseudopilin PulG